MSKLLATYEIQADVFDKILYDLSIHTEYTDDIFQYSYGYKNRNTIYYNEEYLICKECVLDYYCDCLEESTSWRQVRLRKVINASQIVQKTITGNYAYNYIIKLLSKYYTLDEIENILNSHEAEYSEEFKQFHYNLPMERQTLLKFENCFKYDINGAHCDSVVYLFPKAREEFMKLYKERKQKPVYKQLFNFFVGELCRKNHRKTYNWIVQRTTRKLYEAMDTTNGMLLYANTDGFIVQKPETEINTSMNLFDFKLEYSGDVYIYQSNNYILYQFGDEQTGSCRCEVRNDIDLRIGKVVDYKIEKTNIGIDKNGHNRYCYKIVNKTERQVSIDEL